MSIGDRNKHRAQRHRGFTRTNIALEQAIHRTRVSNILCDLAEGRQLIRREFKGKTLENLALDRDAARQRWCALPSADASFDRNGELENQQFVVGKTRTRTEKCGAISRRVHAAIRRGQTNESPLTQVLRRE